jgi:hypothetical protein
VSLASICRSRLLLSGERYDRAVRRTLTVLVAGIVVTACGGSGVRASDEQKVKQTVIQDMAAVADGDGATACSLATQSGRAQLERAVPGKTCEQIVALFSARLPNSAKDGLRTAHISKVNIRGNTATVPNSAITSTRGDLHGYTDSGPPVALAKQPDGSWKISASRP